MPGEAQVAIDCQAVQEALAEHRGEADRLEPAARGHIEVCPGCREAAAAELALGLLFSKAAPPADPELERAVMAALAPVRLRRRLVAFLPVAASLVLAVIGAVVVGGVPGSGVIGLLPGLSAQGWAVFAGSASDAYAVVANGVRAFAGAVNPALVVAAAVLGLVGLFGVVTTAARWRKMAPWRGRR